MPEPTAASAAADRCEQADRCQALWRAVLMLALREDGEAYLLTPDGRAVCEMAGIDPARFRPAVLRATPKRSKAGRHRAPPARSALHWTREQDAALVAMKAAGASSKAIAAAVGRPVPSVWSRAHYLGLRQARA